MATWIHWNLLHSILPWKLIFKMNSKIELPPAILVHTAMEHHIDIIVSSNRDQANLVGSHLLFDLWICAVRIFAETSCWTVKWSELAIMLCVSGPERPRPDHSLHILHLGLAVRSDLGRAAMATTSLRLAVFPHSRKFPLLSGNTIKEFDFTFLLKIFQS